jgi:molybdenum cofactor synthesis domain-containing protein
MTVTAALVLIGNELLRGFFEDENSPYLRDQLADHGIEVAGLHVVSDDVSKLAPVIRLLSSLNDYVLTVGGLGPTIDDVTLEAVAAALELSLESQAPEDVEDYARMSGSESVHALLRHRPVGSEIIHTGHGPVVRTANIFSLPGLPRLVRARFPAVLPHLGGGSIARSELQVNAPQSELAQAVASAAADHSSVYVGVYPRGSISEGTLVALQGQNEAEVAACKASLATALAALGIDVNEAPALDAKAG